MNSRLGVALMLWLLSLACLLMGVWASELARTARRGTVKECVALSGHAISCGSGINRERIRLIGIIAPDATSCRPEDDCPNGDPIWSRYVLEIGMERGPLTIERFGRDRRGFTLASVAAGKTNLSCWQIAQGQADYSAVWDQRHIAAQCSKGKAKQ